MNDAADIFDQAGLRVRLKSDPTRTAITTGKTRRAGPFFQAQVEFGPNERPFKRIEELELIPDQPEEIEDLLRARRWSGPDALRRALALEKIRGTLTDVFYSMESSRTDFYPHQFKPVMKFVESPTGRILIADEVGLGKTIEAVYLWREIEARERARRLLIVCPSMLREKWQGDMDRLFSLEAEIVDSKALRDKLSKARAAPDRTSFALITSFNAARPPRDYMEDHVNGPRAEIARLLHENSAGGDNPLIDLVVIDEAHYMRNANTLTHRLGRLLSDASRHMALLTATPIQIGSENLFNLMRLLDPDIFEHSFQFDAMLHANAPIVEAQRAIWKIPPDPDVAADALTRAASNPYFKADDQLMRFAKELRAKADIEPMRRVELGRALEERSLISPYMNRSRKREVIKRRVERTAQVLEVEFNDEERRTYDRITASLRSRSTGLTGVPVLALIARQRQMASSLPAAIKTWHDKGILDDLAWEDVGKDIGSLSAPDVDVPVDRDLAQRLEASDSKYAKFLEFLTKLQTDNPKEKVIVFAFFRGTLKYLQRRLENDGLATCLIMGGDSRNRAERLEALSQFADPNGPSILLSSEVGSEGIDLQFCRVVVNYDLPWNPMRVEQRIGRVDRLGQKADRISIVNFAVTNTVEDRILMRLYQRIEVFRRTIGDLEEILGDVSNDLLEQLFDPSLTDEERERIAEQSILAIENRRRDQRVLEEQAVNLIGFSDYLLDTISEARNMGRWLSPEETISFVFDFFDTFFAGTSIEPHSDVPNAVNILLSDEARFSLSAYTEKARMPRKTALETTTRPVMCYFDPRRTEAMARNSELVDSMHPLLRWIEAEIATKADNLVPPVALSITSADAEVQPSIYAFAIQKWELRGVRSEVTLKYRAVRLSDSNPLDLLESERLVVNASRKGRRLPYAKLDERQLSAAVRSFKLCLERLNSDFGAKSVEFEAENKRRCVQQETSARRFAERKINELQRRVDKMEAEGKRQGAALTRNQIRKQEDILDSKLSRISRRKESEISMFDIAGGIILVE